MKQHHKKNGHTRLLVGVMIAGSLLLSGCENPKTLKATPPQSAAAQAPATLSVPAPESKVKANRIGQCQSELASLRKVNPKVYVVRKAYFDSLIGSVSVYSAVRGDVNSQTKETLDALYKYKTNQICAQIERDVLDALIRRGESVK